MVRPDGKDPPQRRRTRSASEVEETPGPTAENDRRESREKKKKKSARKERKRSRDRSRSRSSTPGSGGRPRRSPKGVTVEVSAEDSGAGTGLQEAEDISQRVQVDNLRDSGVVLDLPKAGVDQSVVTATAPDTAVVPSSVPASLPVSQEEVNPVGVKPDENKPDEQEVLDSSVSAKPEDKPWEFQVCRDVDQFGKPLRGLQENDQQFDYRTSLWQRDAAPHPRQDDWDASNQRPKPSTGGWGKPAAVKPAASGGWGAAAMASNRPWGQPRVFRPQNYLPDGSRKPSLSSSGRDYSGVDSGSNGRDMRSFDPKTRPDAKVLGGISSNVRSSGDKPVDMMTAGYEKSSPFDRDDGSGSDSSTSSYVSSSSDGHYRRKSRGSSSGASVADKAIESALAKQAATIPTIPKSVMAKVKNSAPRCFANLEVLLQSKNTARELWFTALVQLLPENLISIRELAAINDRDVGHHVKYETLKALVITTYNDPEAAAKERKLLVDLRMLEGRGPNEFYARLISQFEVCENTTRCDVSLQTVADTFLLGLPSALRSQLIIKMGQPTASSTVSMRSFVAAANELYTTMKAAQLPINSPQLGVAAIGTRKSLNLGNVPTAELVSELNSRHSAETSELLSAIGFKRSKPPAFEGDKDELLRLLRSKYSASEWKEREELMKQNVKLSDKHDKFFKNDKSADGKYVCVYCWKLKHTASRCKTAKSKNSFRKDRNSKDRYGKGKGGR
jgi:hypothetical protein